MNGVDLILWRLRCGFGVHPGVLGWCGRGEWWTLAAYVLEEMGGRWSISLQVTDGLPYMGKSTWINSAHIPKQQN